MRSKRLKIYNGDYEYFKTMKEREIEQERDLLERKKVKSTVKEWKVRSKNILKVLDKKKNALEDEIKKMEDEIEELSRSMDENPSNYTLLGKLHEDREVLEEKCIEKYMEFEEITIEIEEEKERDNEN